MTQHFERTCYEVRSELAWTPVIPLASPATLEPVESQQATIREAIGILETRLKTTQAFTNPSDVRQFCQLHIAAEKDEHFCCMFMDSQHRLIAFEKLFRGTIDGASVYPRVVTQGLKDALALIDIRVVDHIIAGTDGTSSMAEAGLL